MSHPNLTDNNILLLVDAGFDLVGFTSLTLTIDRPGGAGQVVVNPPTLVVGSQSRYSNLATLLGNQYVEYLLVPGDVTVAGQYLCHLRYTGPAVGNIIPHATFIIWPS